jgi:putative endonuclease
VKEKAGKRGEDIAAAYLEKEGFLILERNWRYRRSEIDIIAREGDVLVFVEVKYRTSDQYGSPEAFVSEKQIGMIADAAAAYAQSIGYEWEVRFDILGILELQGSLPVIKLYRDAFFPS